MRRGTEKWTRAGALVIAGLTASAACALDPPEFYSGKTVTVYVGYSAGGGYDLYARILARHLVKHLPGRPAVVVQNMPGAGSLKALEYLYSVAPKDGTAIGTFSRSLPIAPLLEPARYDGAKFRWLGSVVSDTSVCVASAASPIKAWDDLFRTTFTAGGEGKGADPDVIATLLKTVYGARVKLVTGYPGSAEIDLAMERGEVDGQCGISYSTIKSRHRDWIDQRKVNIIVQAALKKDRDLPDVPLLPDLAKTERQKGIMRLMLAPQEMARPFAAPPDTPDDRFLALRAAFDRTTRDPEFVAEMKKQDLDLDPMPGAAIDALLKGLYATPPDLLRAAAAALKTE